MLKQTSPVAIVTGASTGIGRATAAALRKEGYQVFGTSRKPAAQGPQGVEMCLCDVTDAKSVSDLITYVVEKTGRIDILVNNAGLGITAGAEEVSVDLAKSLFEVNVFGALRMIGEVLPIMRRQKGGRIINLSSVLGFMPAPYMAHYAATKHALEGYSESLDHEVRGFGIRVLLIEPAYTRTSFDANALSPDRVLGIYEDGRAGAEAVMEKAMTSGDDPETVAQTVLKAVSDRTPKLRYPAGKMAKQVSLLRRFVPAAAFDKSLRQQNGLPV
ncbi:oxidoreductase [Asticcacaulis excentricus]|uniref:3-oxoacyl-[acyl-carrier protein] reductase n=1 Tax=Asticcacaulis excentricus TaxID=78587 RepID=A0A3G9G9M2_9CAUL|nr:oxidoreductase [Asticcacaulis excentricus]BBF82685.1 3-oxoacyl-[acyl-carrier protein] reductase [Asticcacaulis excentricus]